MNWQTGLVWALAAVWALFLLRALRQSGPALAATTRQITVDAMFLAIIFLMGFVPQLGYLTILPGLALTLLHLPVLIGSYLYGWRRGLLYGLAFGLTSWAMALSSGAGLNALFAVPWVSVLPRLVWGALAGAAFDLPRKNPKIYGNPAAVGGIAFLLTLGHTALVFGALFLFYGTEMRAFFGGGNVILNGLSFTLVGFLALGALGEALLGALVTPLVGKALLRLQRSEPRRL